MTNETKYETIQEKAKNLIFSAKEIYLQQKEDIIFDGVLLTTKLLVNKFFNSGMERFMSKEKAQWDTVSLETSIINLMVAEGMENGFDLLSQKIFEDFDETNSFLSQEGDKTYEDILQEVMRSDSNLIDVLLGRDTGDNVYSALVYLLNVYMYFYIKTMKTTSIQKEEGVKDE